MRILTRIFAFIGFMVVLSLALSIASALWMRKEGPKLPAHVVLEFDFGRPIRETGEASPLRELLGDKGADLRTLIRALNLARQDKRVAGLVANLSDADLEPAQIEELRSALKRFTDSGRFAYAWADSFGELGPGNRAYWLASAFTDIRLQPLGLLSLTGAAMTQPFARTVLDRLGIIPDVHQRYEYKGVAETFTAASMPAPLRENYQTLLNDIHGNMVRDIAASRKINEAKLRDIINHAPVLGQAALEDGLIDGLGYQDEMRKKALEQAGSGAAFFDLADYYYAAPRSETKGTVALVHINGPIVGRADERGPMGERNVASAETLVKAIADASAEAGVSVIVLRINSPGGSVSASESIHHAIKQAQASGKYVIASMGDMAASGGYWIASAADYIVAQPSTITGSIGVVAGKLVIGPLSERLGVNWSTLTTGTNSGMWAPNEVFRGDGLARIEASLDEVYKGFTQRVADSRHLTLEQVDKLARGRVWTGTRAKELGLVDELGSMSDAFNVARTHMGLEKDVPVMTSNYPKPETPGKQLIRLLQQFVAAPQLHPLSWSDIAPAAAALLHLPDTQAGGAVYYTGPVLAN